MGQASLAKRSNHKFKRQHIRTNQQLRKRHVTLPDMPWDSGADGPANREHLHREDAVEADPETGKQSNPNKVTRMRRVQPIDAYLRQGRLTLRQVAIARELRDAAEGARAQDPLAAVKIDKDRSVKGTREAAVDARRKFLAMWSHVPLFARPVIEHVVIEGRYVWAMPSCKQQRTADRQHDRLCHGLDALESAWT